MTTELTIDSDRLWASIRQSAEFGDSGDGGVRRLALDDADRAVRDWFRHACEQAGCRVVVDAMGSMFAIRAGRSPDRPWVGFGSHLDTQPTGGRFDGILGVCAGLEIMRVLNDAGIETERSLCLVNWTNEEGSRFQPGMMASGVFVGHQSLSQALASFDHAGITVAAALERIGYDGTVTAEAVPLGCFVELHIEQGPYLEAEGALIGAVEGAYGLSWYDGRITGASAHAGATPMTLRRDAFSALCELSLALEEMARETATAAVATVGEVAIAHQSRNTIPGDVTFTIDMRTRDAATSADVEKRLSALVSGIGRRRSVQMSVDRVLSKPASRFDGRLTDMVASAADARGYPVRRMLSGAGHDACHLSTTVPTTMIFIPCRDGVSHNAAEFAEKDHCAAGASVLLDLVQRLAAESAGRTEPES